MLTWISNICLYVVIDIPAKAARAVKNFTSKWWYSHYQ